jgi:hypothetical protein
LRPSSVDEKLAYMISFLVGVFLMATIIGQVSDMIAHANPGDVRHTLEKHLRTLCVVAHV